MREDSAEIFVSLMKQRGRKRGAGVITQPSSQSAAAARGSWSQYVIIHGRHFAFEVADGGDGSALTSPFKPVTLRFDCALALSAQTQSVKLPVIRDASRSSEFAHPNVPTEIRCCSAAERQACTLTRLIYVG